MDDDGHDPSTCNYQECRAVVDTPCPFGKDTVMVKADDEHIFVPLAGGTSVRCSCGKEFGTAAEADQHRWWQLQLVLGARTNPANYTTNYPTWQD